MVEAIRNLPDQLIGQVAHPLQTMADLDALLERIGESHLSCWARLRMVHLNSISGVPV